MRVVRQGIQKQIGGAIAAQMRGFALNLAGKKQPRGIDAGAHATIEMQASKGRAAFLGARSVGHADPGARSSCVLLHAVCNALEARP